MPCMHQFPVIVVNAAELLAEGLSPTVPLSDGLRELSSDIIREVLRHQPEHLNGFIADYLETMLVVRENARDSGAVICDTLRQGYFFDELFKTKNVTRDQANVFVTIIQAAWRGYIVRRKIGEWLKKKKKFEEEKEMRRSIRIEELLAGLGITYSEATRAAGVIQAAYKESKRGKWISGDFGEFWVGESVPFGQRIREGDRVHGRYDRWEKEDFGDFFEMDDTGAIKYVWPRFGQVRKVLRENIPSDLPTIQFFGMRDLEGVEQYSYLIKTQPNAEVRGTPLGFLVPMLKSSVRESVHEVQFVNPENVSKMGSYTYIFRDNVTREDLAKFDELLKTQAKATANLEMVGELDYDPNWVLPRVLIRIKKHMLLKTDDESRQVFGLFVWHEETDKCNKEGLSSNIAEAFRFRHIPVIVLLWDTDRDKCLTVEEGLNEAANMAPYVFQETGRIFPVENFLTPKYIQKIQINPESSTGEDESLDLLSYEYIFLPLDHMRDRLVKGEPEPILIIPISRFQGFHSDYKGSESLKDKVFIMGPKITTPDGKPFTYESLFWDEFGPEAWYQLLYNIAIQETQVEEEEEVLEEEMEILSEENFVDEALQVMESGKKVDEYDERDEKSSDVKVRDSAATILEAATSVEASTEQTSEQMMGAEAKMENAEEEESEKEKDGEKEKESERETEKEPEMVDT